MHSGRTRSWREDTQGEDPSMGGRTWQREDPYTGGRTWQREDLSTGGRTHIRRTRPRREAPFMEGGRGSGAPVQGTGFTRHRVCCARIPEPQLLEL